MQGRFHKLPVVIMVLVVVPFSTSGDSGRNAFFHKNPYIFPLVLSTVNLRFNPDDSLQRFE